MLPCQLLEIRRRRSDARETDAPEIIRFSYDRLGQMLTEETVQKFKIIHLT
ncbi:type IV secretion protein Rhs [Escherichia coli]|nr:type IV secretion protein Rhs [Escherichia coli]OYI42478.1 type IV secretion protein Rhs [Shigella sonnei]EEY8749809.1 type IV secretion protein Rhs [Escherichia coli]EFB3950333.1 type IV secretion protein Rhs [Escherichia coli]EFE7497764.1 type IV secretion protein Rhs [Escherichia coli]